VERITWMTEERIGASGTGAPSLGRTGARGVTAGGLQIHKRDGFVPPAYGPGLVCGTTVLSHTNDHAAMGRTAWDGTPLGSPGAGYG